MIVKNHFNEEIEVDYIKKIERVSGCIVKVNTGSGYTEYYNYDNFMYYNPDFDWDELE